MATTETTGADLALGPVVQVSLLVRDMERAVTFYGSTLGLEHLFTVGDLAFFTVDGMRLYLHRVDDADWRPGSVVYFLVEDITAAYAALQARGVETAGAPHHVWTDDAAGVAEWMAFFNDPDGNMLSILARLPTSGEG